MTTTDGKGYDSETYFPFSLVEDVIEILKAKGTHFSRYCDLDLRLTIPLFDWLAFQHEYWKYRCGSRSYPETLLRKVQSKAGKMLGKAWPAGKGDKYPTVVLQHDADQQPYKTVDLMKLEREMGVVSSSYFFKEQNLDPEKTYHLPVDELQNLESSGFEIGYHLNAFERSHYHLEECMDLVNEEIGFFDSNFNLRSFVPHGGVPSEDGLNNHDIPYQGILRKYPWCYNGRGFAFCYAWSDGEPYSAPLQDPRLIADALRPGQRARFLMHPQYYGHELSPRYVETALPDQKWWRDLWGL